MSIRSAICGLGRATMVEKIRPLPRLLKLILSFTLEWRTSKILASLTKVLIPCPNLTYPVAKKYTNYRTQVASFYFSEHIK